MTPAELLILKPEANLGPRKAALIESVHLRKLLEERQSLIDAVTWLMSKKQEAHGKICKTDPCAKCWSKSLLVTVTR